MLPATWVSRNVPVPVAPTYIRFERSRADCRNGHNVKKAEEIENAAIIIPRSMCASVIINGFLGLGMLIAVLFCLGNLENALTTPTGFPFIEIFRQATNSTSGGTVMVSSRKT